jgi:tRNA dimethylallyltransferase
MARDAIVLTGPTAVGKTALAIRVARRLDAEIVSVDSRQVYRGLDIGTAKATAEERAAVPHHGLDVVDPDVRYSAGRFARDARGWIDGIRERGRVPLLVGGTGFFLRALMDPLFEEPPMDRDRRHRLEGFLEGVEEERLRDWLGALDPESAERLERSGGRQRVLRAIEVAVLTGRPLGWWHRERPGSEPGIDALVFVLHRPRSELYARIDQRVDAMLDAGLLEETARLLEAGYGDDAPGMSATGYPEASQVLSGELDREEAADRIRRRTRRYARRQLTWFRNKLPADAVWLDGRRPTDELVDEVVERWDRVR